MKKTVQIKDLTIGSGIPKICVPITGKTSCEILSQAKAIREAGPDLVEWRVDFYEGMEDNLAVEQMLLALEDVLQEIPILFTVRTDREGSSTHVDEDLYEEILIHAASCPQTALIDVEVMPQQESAARIIKKAHEKGVPVIASNHHFEGTPSNEEIDRIFSCMEASGADMLKMAVMPKEKKDVLRMMERTSCWEEMTDRPLITMSMGTLGCVSRMCGELTGSGMTFASVTAASAPGQIDMASLKNILQILHGES